MVDSLIVEDLSEADVYMIDSCLKAFHNEKDDTAKVNAISFIVEECWDDNVWPKYNNWVHDFVKNKLNEELSLINEAFYKRSYAGSLNNIGYLYMNQGNLDQALYYYNQSLKIEEEIGNKEGVAYGLNNIGYLYNEQGNLSIALEFYFKSLKIQEEINDKEGVANSLNNIGAIYKGQNDLQMALDYMTKSLEIRKEIAYKDGIATSLNNVGSIYSAQGNYLMALDYYNQSLKIQKETGGKSRIAYSLNNIGSMWSTLGDTLKALGYYHQALAIQEDLQDNAGIVYSLNNIGSIEMLQGKTKLARANISRALKIAKELGYPEDISISADYLSQIALKQNNFKEAYEMHLLYITMRDSINNDETIKAVTQQQAKYKYEKQALADSVFNASQIKIHKALLKTKEVENTQHILEAKQQKQQKYYVFGGLALVVLFSLFIFNRFKVTQKQKKIIELAHKKTELQKQEIELQKSELEATHDQLAEHHKEITDSINYAEMIQKAVLPTLKIKDLQHESFIYYNPKEKVSGDFYWLEQKENYSGYCVADCTGHGIPGAFISMVGTILLNEIYNSKKIEIPNKVLDELSRLVKLTLTNKEGYAMKDGMDISFVALNNLKNVLYFSGANNPVWIISSDKTKNINLEIQEPKYTYESLNIYELKGDKQPVGDYGELTKPFSLHSVKLNEGDTFYLFSDGYVDQFGGPKNKKFKAKAFRELLVGINEYPMLIQKEKIETCFLDWKKDTEQIDDVTILGVRV